MLSSRGSNAGLLPVVLTVLFLAANGCSSAPTREEPADAQAGKVRMDEMGTSMQQLAQRLSALEAKFEGVNEKLNATRMSLDNFLSVQKSRIQGVNSHANDARGVPVGKKPAEKDVSTGFVDDPAVRSYRDAKILFDAEKYSSSILAFSAFIANYPDHPLAGASQYYLGESYFRQGEYKLALDEYQRVVSTYDRSSHVPDALKRMIESEEKLNLPEHAGKHRQLLLSTFPQSPAAKELQLAAAPKAAEEPTAVAPVADPVQKGEPLPTAPVGEAEEEAEE